MFTFLLMVCLASMNEECITLIPDPPRYFITKEECEVQLQLTANQISERLTESNVESKFKGKCFFDRTVTYS
jgi:hypothetical protein